MVAIAPVIPETRLLIADPRLLFATASIAPFIFRIDSGVPSSDLFNLAIPVAASSYPLVSPGAVASATDA